MVKVLLRQMLPLWFLVELFVCPFGTDMVRKSVLCLVLMYTMYSVAYPYALQIDHILVKTMVLFAKN